MKPDTADRELDVGDETYRQELRKFIADRAPGVAFTEGVRVPRDANEEALIRSWLGALYAAGYLGAGWPVAWGGRADHRPTRDLILMEELIRARAYRPLDQVMLASHAILEFGSQAQQEQYLPRIRSGEHIWCQLFSEPDAGSDLASLRTRAEPDGEDFVVTGQKTWCTDAQWADMGMLLARTDPTQDRHAGLTAFVVPMDLPGLTIRPIREMTGSEEFCEVFLDGVRLGPEHVLGGLGQGWPVISSGLASERAFVGANALQLEMMFRDLVALARSARLPDDSTAIEHEDVQVELARLLVRVEAAKLVVKDVVDRIVRNEEHPSDGPFAKLAYSELYVALCEAALELLASAASVDEPGREPTERWYAAFLWSRALTISGGASEILRGLIGRQLLALPRA
jgi:alkylation response protein AidB-like acyl-CoA dehydrogenase